MIRVLLADDHSLMRAGLRALLTELPEVEVVAEAGDGAEALRLIREYTPDVALLDISMPTLNGIEVALQLTKEHAATRILILSMHMDDEFVRGALAAGAVGYLVKNADRAELEMAVRAVARGDTWLSPAIAKRVAAAYAEQQTAGRRGGGQSVPEVLTPRQREVLKLIAEGLSTKEMARRLDVSAKTIETHRAELMDRLGIHSVAGLVRYAVRLGLVRPEP